MMKGKYTLYFDGGMLKMTLFDAICLVTGIWVSSMNTFCLALSNNRITLRDLHFDCLWSDYWFHQHGHPLWCRLAWKIFLIHSSIRSRIHTQRYVDLWPKLNLLELELKIMGLDLCFRRNTIEFVKLFQFRLLTKPKSAINLGSSFMHTR